MAINLPRISNDEGSPYNPANFIATWAATMDALEGALGNGVSGGGYDQDLLGAGRIAGLDYLSGDATAPRTPSSPSLTLELPNAKWFVEGQKIEIDDPFDFLVIGGVPADQAAGVYGYVSLSDNDDAPLEITPEHWSTTLRPAWTAAGLACVGLVKTDDTTVLEIDATHADVILPNPVIRQWLKSLSAPVSGGGTGDGIGRGDIIPWNLADTRDIVTVVLALIAALRAEVEDVISNGGRRPMATHVDQLMHELAIVRQIAGLDHPTELERSQSANILGVDDGSVYGDGTNDHPNHLGPTTLTLNEDGSFEP